MEDSELIDEAVKAKEVGFGGTKIKVGRPHVAEDVRGFLPCAKRSALAGRS
jgi:hypothetical protein